jgi:hypothetical protein
VGDVSAQLVGLIHLFPDAIQVLANVGINRELTRGNT